jgi:hypothetical protein
MPHPWMVTADPLNKVTVCCNTTNGFGPPVPKLGQNHWEGCANPLPRLVTAEGTFSLWSEKSQRGGQRYGLSGPEPH